MDYQEVFDKYSTNEADGMSFQDWARANTDNNGGIGIGHILK